MTDYLPLTNKITDYWDTRSETNTCVWLLSRSPMIFSRVPMVSWNGMNTSHHTWRRLHRCFMESSGPEDILFTM